jgi:hypothetical protein
VHVLRGSVPAHVNLLMRMRWGLLDDERGIALPVAMGMLFVISSLAFVVAIGARTSGSQSRFDRSVKRSLAAVDAGIDTAIYRLNTIQPSSTQCVTVSGSGQNAQLTVTNSTNGWCPEVTEDLGDGESFAYRMSTAASVSFNGQNLLQRKIVSTGSALNGATPVKRRTLSVVTANTGNPLVGNYALLSADPSHTLVMETNGLVQGDIGTNGNVLMRNSAVVCGDIYHGIGKTATFQNSARQGGNPECFGTNWQSQTCPQDPHDCPEPLPETVVLAPVPPIPAQNDNNTLAGYAGWDPSKRMLTVNSSLTLTGGVYNICRLVLNNGSDLIIPPRFGVPLKMFIDRPSNCPNLSESERDNPVSINGNSLIRNLNADPALFTLFVVGDSSDAGGTLIDFNNSADDQVAMVLYAPYSKFDMRNATRMRGAVAAWQISIKNHTQVVYDPLVGALTLEEVKPFYRRVSWAECKVIPPNSTPDSGC